MKTENITNFLRGGGIMKYTSKGTTLLEDILNSTEYGHSKRLVEVLDAYDIKLLDYTDSLFNAL